MSESFIDSVLADNNAIIEQASLHTDSDEDESNEVVQPAQPVTEFEREVELGNSILDALMARIGDVDEQSPYMNLCVYGPPGVGKSVFLGTADNNLIIDVEDGAKSIKNHKELLTKPGKAQSLEYKSVFQVEQLIGFMKQRVPQFDRYEVLSVDSFNALADRALQAQVKAEAQRDSSRNAYLPLGPDYNINTQHMKTLATDMHDLDRHIVFLCHSKEVKDDSTGKILIRPDLTPKLAGAIAGIFDLVGYLTADIAPDGTISNRRLQVHPTDKILAKSRIGNLPAIIENPTFNMILEAYRSN